MLKASAFLRNPLSFLFARTAAEDRAAQYLIREHGRGRRLAEVMEDHYIQNRLGPQQQRRLLDRQDVIDAVSHDDLTSARAHVESLR